MKRKKSLYGFLAAAVLLNSAAWPAPAAKAAAPDLESGLKAYYSFDEGTLENSKAGNSASAVLKGLGSYGERVSYSDEGKAGKAVKLDGYGLKLNQEDLGDDFTVSVWLKADGTLAENQSVLFLGYHSPEKWFSVAGNRNNTSECKAWANGNGYAWKTLGTLGIGAGEWHCLTLTGTGGEMSAWLDGEKAAAGTSNQPLTGANQDIYVGVTNWDTAFAGLVDEVRVYDRALTESEIYQLYDGRTAEEILEEDGFTVKSSMQIPIKRTDAIRVELPAVVTESGASISYESSDPAVVSVNESGEMKALKEGSADITVTVTLGETKKTAVVSVTVAGTLEDALAAYYPFEENLENQKGSGTASAIQTGLKAYAGEVQYEDGKEGKAVSLKDYGIQLNQKNLGEEYTVSMWFKPNSNLASNQCMLFMGYHNPEKWTAVSGDSAGVYKIWANGGSYGTWTTLFSPAITAEEWYHLTLAGTAGEVSVYLDGIKLGTKPSNDPLSGSNQDIYLGVNNWDPEFDGLVDEVKVYTVALSEEEIQEQEEKALSEKLQAKLEKAVGLENILGKNETADAVKYDLALPQYTDGAKIEWESSSEAVVGTDGKVVSPEETTEVTLTAKITSGLLNASKSFKVSVIPLDKTDLDELIEEAEAVNRENLVTASEERLEKAIADAKSASSYSEAERAHERLKKAMSELCYQKDYENPFASIADPAVQITKKAGETEALFTVPGNVKDAVEVKYISEKPEMVSYADGMITALQPGKTVVTAVVTAKYDQWEMEYSTAVNVEKKAETDKPDDNPTDQPDDNPTDDPNDQPDENPTDKPDDKPNDKPNNKPDNKPNDKSDDKTNGNGSSSSGGSSSKSSGSAGASSQTQSAAGADTGDSTNLWLPILGIFAGAAAIFAVWFYRKKKSS